MDPWLLKALQQRASLAKTIEDAISIRSRSDLADIARHATEVANLVEPLLETIQGSSAVNQSLSLLPEVLTISRSISSQQAAFDAAATLRARLGTISGLGDWVLSQQDRELPAGLVAEISVAAATYDNPEDAERTLTAVIQVETALEDALDAAVGDARNDVTRTLKTLVWVMAIAIVAQVSYAQYLKDGLADSELAFMTASAWVLAIACYWPTNRPNQRDHDPPDGPPSDQGTEST